METAGKEVDDAELREAMKDSGIGTPATRAAIIERLVSVGYLEREGRALVATEKAIQVVRLLGEHPLTSPELTGELGAPAGPDRARRGHPARLHARHRRVHHRDGERARQAEGRRRSSGPSSARARSAAARSENRKGYSCWSKDDPGCGFVIWKKKASKTLPPSVVKELMATGAATGR